MLPHPTNCLLKRGRSDRGKYFGMILWQVADIHLQLEYLEGEFVEFCHQIEEQGCREASNITGTRVWSSTKSPSPSPTPPSLCSRPSSQPTKRQKNICGSHLAK